MLQAYLQRPDVDINARPLNGDNDEALLDYAAELDRIDVARYLLDHGARVDAIQEEGLDRGLTPLHRAAQVDAADVAELLLERGAEVDYHGPLGNTPLLYAASHDSRRTAEVLLRHGAAIDTTNGHLETALSIATAKGYREIVDLLLQYVRTPTAQELDEAAARADVRHLRLWVMRDQRAHDLQPAAKNLALRFALLGSIGSASERKQAVESLIADGADINGRTDQSSITPVMLVDTPELLQLLIAHGADLRVDGSYGPVVVALACSARIRDPLGVFQVLLAHGVDLAAVPPKGLDALECAVRRHSPELEDFLLSHGVPVDLRDDSGRSALFWVTDQATFEPLLQHGANVDLVDSRGATAMSVALASGNAALARLLASRVAVSTSARADQSALSTAAQAGDLRVVAGLLARGADINRPDGRGNTPLQVAIQAGRDEVASYLITHGADVNARRQDGATALHLAAERNDRVLVAQLLDHHADATALDRERLPPARRATSMQVRALFARHGVAVDMGPSTTDLRACAEVAAGRVSARGPLEDSPTPPQEPSDDWNYFDQIAREQRVRVLDRDYRVGVGDAGPVYLARLGPDAVESIVCTFDHEHHVMTRLERLQARSKRDFQTLSLESLKVVGLAGAQALLAASQDPRHPLFLTLDSDGNLLGDAILGHRDDVLAFYLEQGVSANLAWVAHASVDPTHAPPFHDDPLYTAVTRGTPDSLELLLAHGANPDGGGGVPHQPALAAAVRAGQLTAVRALLDHGANPNLPASSYALFSTVEDISRNSGNTDDEVAAVLLLLQHGADPEPWIHTAFQLYAQDKQLQDLLRLMDATHEVRTSWIQTALAAPGPGRPAEEKLLRQASALRDAADCPPAASVSELTVCLPGALRAADDELRWRLSHDAHPGSWSSQRDRQCGLPTLPGQSSAGWLSRALSDPQQALCLLQATRRKLAELHDLPAGPLAVTP